MTKPDTFLAHIEPLQGMLAGYARRMLRDPSQIEDVLQAALRTAYEKFNLYTEGTNFKAWIFRILTLEIFAANRRFEQVVKMEVPLDPEAVDWSVAIGRELDYGQFLENVDSVMDRLDAPLSEALGSLPPIERSVLLLRAIGGLPYKEIAETLDVPMGSALGYISRARAKLRERLASYASERGWLDRNRREGA